MRALTALRAKVAQFGRETRAIAAVEFAIAFPFLFALMGGVFEISRAVDTSRRLTTAAIATSTMISANTTGTVSYLDLHYAVDSVMISFPGVLSDSASKNMTWSSDISVSLAGISFTPTPSTCTSSCTYKANVVWTGASATRACGSTLTSGSNTAAPTPSTLPPGLYNTVASPSGTLAPPFAIVVDVSYAWTPILFSKVVGPITIKRSAFINPRYLTQITYNKISGDDGYGKECPGF